MAYHEPAVEVPAKVAILGVIDTIVLHVPEDSQPTQHLALLADIVAQWHQ